MRIWNFAFKVSPQTRHTIEKVFTPFGLPGVPFSIEEKVFDFALIKLGNMMIRLQSKISEESSDSDKDVNDCEAEDAEKCWEITQANLATMDTPLSVGQNVLALGKIKNITTENTQL